LSAAAAGICVNAVCGTKINVTARSLDASEREDA
jgi:hypothetical protein